MFLSVIGYGKFGKALSKVANYTHFRYFDVEENDLNHACFIAENPTEHCVLVALPANQVATVLAKLPTDRQYLVLLTCKGVDRSGLFLPQILAGKQYRLAAFAGPHFAAHIETATVASIACADEDRGQLAHLFSKLNPTFSHDVLALQVQAVMKNLAAYALGACSTLDLGPNVQAAMFSRCLDHTQELLLNLGCTSTLMNPVLADWFMCCTNPQSRNFQAGARSSVNVLTESLENIEAMYGQFSDNALVRLVHDYHKTRDNILLLEYIRS